MKKIKFNKTMTKIMAELKTSVLSAGCFQGERSYNAAMKLIEMGIVEKIAYEGGEFYRYTKIRIPRQISLRLIKENK